MKSNGTVCRGEFDSVVNEDDEHDSDSNLDVTKCILEQEGAQVVLAGNGQEAFERIEAELGCIDLVLMDMQMRVLDGRDAARRIRFELRAELPIIALTTHALSSELPRATAVGMDGLTVKPFDRQTLVDSILRQVRPAGRPLAGHPSAALCCAPHPCSAWAGGVRWQA